jgi:hypothetical protein
LFPDLWVTVRDLELVRAGVAFWGLLPDASVVGTRLSIRLDVPGESNVRPLELAALRASLPRVDPAGPRGASVATSGVEVAVAIVGAVLRVLSVGPQRQGSSMLR